MEQMITIIHVVTAIAIIGLIMIQQGKGADAGASFGGGSSQTVFGAAGGGNMLTRMTSVAVTVFFVTSLSLAVVAKNKAASIGDIDIGIPVMQAIDSEELVIPEDVIEKVQDIQIPE